MFEKFQPPAENMNFRIGEVTHIVQNQADSFPTVGSFRAILGTAEACSNNGVCFTRRSEKNNSLFFVDEGDVGRDLILFNNNL